MTNYKMVECNGDKAHRCPQCHCIPDEARKDGVAKDGKVYYCDTCKVSWVAHYITWEEHLASKEKKS